MPVENVKNLRDKWAAITGAGSGIGRALAIQLADEGCRVAISGLTNEGLSETARLVGARGALVDSTLVDVADREAVHAWADRLVAVQGAPHLVFNNAGVVFITTVETMSYEDLEWVMRTNFWGVVHGTKAFLPHLKRAGEGRIVNVSSVLGLVGFATQAPYTASKFAIRGFTEALRQELEVEDCGVSAICVYPSGVKTNLLRSARMCDGEVLGMERGTVADGFDHLARISADRVARAIIRGVKRNKPRILIGRDARLADCLQRLLPTGYRRLIVNRMRRAGVDPEKDSRSINGR